MVTPPLSVTSVVGATNFQISGQFAATTPGTNNGGLVSGFFEFNPSEYDPSNYSLATPFRLANWNITTTPDGSLVSGNTYAPGANSSGTVALNEDGQWFFRFAFGSGDANIRLQFVTPVGVAGNFPNVRGSELKGIYPPFRSRQLISASINLAAPPTPLPSPTPTPDPIPDPIAPVGVVLDGTNRRDILTGKETNDTLRGLGGNDVLRGLDGDDMLIGGNGNDALRGGAGDDVLDGGKGNDKLIGNAGRDTFALIKGRGEADVIQGFRNGQDWFDLPRGVSFRNIDVTQMGNRVVLSLGDDVLATVTGIRANQVNAADFV